MGYSKVIENMIEQKLLSLHTAYLATVVSTNGKTAKIQPLGYIKAYGGKAQKQSPLSSVPIINSAKFKFKAEEGAETATVTPLSAGDVVICVCCERDITEAKNGRNTTPSIGHHSMSDSIIVGVI